MEGDMTAALHLYTLPPDLHAAVREAYRRAMAEHRSDQRAFDLALALVVGSLPELSGGARRAVAIMLANDPSVVGAAPPAGQLESGVPAALPSAPMP
jgi:ABC-type lipoprotein export system ATPase subunit